MKIASSLLVASNLLGADAWIPYSLKRSNVVSFATVSNKDIGPATGNLKPKIGINTSVDIEAKAELRVESKVEKLAEKNVEKDIEAKINAQYHSGVAPTVLSETVSLSVTASPQPTPKKVKKVKRTLTPEQIRAIERAAELKVEAAMEAKVEKAAEQAVEKLMERSVEVEQAMAASQIIPQVSQQTIPSESKVEAQPLPEVQVQTPPTPIVPDEPLKAVAPAVPAPTVPVASIQPIVPERKEQEAEKIKVPTAVAAPVSAVTTAPAQPIAPERKEQVAEKMLAKKNTEAKLNELAEEVVEKKIEAAVEKAAETAAEKIVSETYGHIAPKKVTLQSAKVEKIPSINVEKNVELDAERISEKSAAVVVVEKAEKKILAELKAKEAERSKKEYLAHRALLIRRLEIEAAERALKKSLPEKLLSDVASLAKGESSEVIDEEEQITLLQRAAELIVRDVPLTSESLTEKYANIESIEERAYQILVDLGMVIVHQDPDSPDYDHTMDDDIVPEGTWV